MLFTDIYGLHTYSKRHNKFLLPVPAKAIYGSFCRTENEIFNVVNYSTISTIVSLSEATCKSDFEEIREKADLYEQSGIKKYCQNFINVV